MIEQLGLSTAGLEISRPSDRILSWHAHIVFIARKKTLIAVNEQTFYTVIMPGMKKMVLKHFADEFRSALFASLMNEGFQEHHVNFLFGERIFYAKSYDRQVLGIINEVVKHIRYHVEGGGGWGHTGVVELTKQINRTPWLAGTRSCVFPIEKITDDLNALSFRGV